MISYQLRDGRLFVEGSTVAVPLPGKVHEALPFANVVVASLEPNGKVSHNVYGIDSRGDVAWQIDEPKNDVHAQFIGIHWVRPGVVNTYWDRGFVFELDARTGRVLKRLFTK